MGVTAVFENGFLRVAVPEGWKVFYGTDSGGNETPKKLHIYKNAQDPLDIFKKAGITVCLNDCNTFRIDTRMFYDNVVDIPPVKLGEHIWNGYTCTSCGYPYTMLETPDGRLQVMILRENGEHKISMEDMDVRTILESIAIC